MFRIQRENRNLIGIDHKQQTYIYNCANGIKHKCPNYNSYSSIVLIFSDFL